MRRHLILFLCLLLLSACSLTPEKTENEQQRQQQWLAKQAQLNKLSHWKINGSIAAYSQQEDWSARFHWRQQNQAYSLRLHAPLGQGMLNLSGDEQGVILKTAQQTLRAKTPEALLKDDAGISMPVSYLYYWIRGLPVPTQPITAQQWNQKNQLAELQQNGWVIEYERYQQWDGVLLPKKLRIKNDQYHAKIVISRWELK
ncbi:lipoprotein insertase outer membrane protein LolB [Candidatus Venteria ishoeyi]|uniref:Outer-membrane lipoprotein LolB n=1 Tax=Candidatus Venteria ishoeyi TaxID=1899563 RepID=A0A1H6FG93_9GAMM|nr:lipoprotein insertase outer membrane protein LolB [Candidatus Venteria ishoeyi]MDM8545674.1 lipoprotein insertase outer membrane protein LolB [Candidatus Venteria ishoeyi]SEH09057.1 Outer-membrane lipoprotein LolB precursor [Candidatus Venteria ishoeyi]